MAAKIRQSKQRDTILDILQHTTSHPTADEVYTKAREIIPDISLGTVYRNLNFLADHGMILRIKSEDSTVHFDGNVTPHYHFYCVKCGQIKDIFPTDNHHKQLLSWVESAGNQVLASHVSFTGICAQCAKKEAS